MQAVIGGCRSCPFPCLRSGNRRPPQKPAETRVSTPSGNATATTWVQLATAADAPEAKPRRGPSPRLGVSSWRFQAPNNGQPITPRNNKEISMRRDEPEGPELPCGRHQPEDEEPGFLWPRRQVSWPSASCCSSFSSPSVGAWSSGMRSSSTPRTRRRRTRFTPSSPVPAGWRSRNAGIGMLSTRDTLNKAVIVWIVIAEATMGVRTASRGLLGRAWSR